MDLEQARQLLELDREATRQQIKAAYRRAARRWHPDKAPPGDQEKYHLQMQKINEAYHRILTFLENYRYRLEEPAAAPDDYQSWWHSHFGGTMGWPHERSRRRPPKP